MYHFAAFGDEGEGRDLDGHARYRAPSRGAMEPHVLPVDPFEENEDDASFMGEDEINECEESVRPFNFDEARQWINECASPWSKRSARPNGNREEGGGAPKQIGLRRELTERNGEGVYHSQSGGDRSWKNYRGSQYKPREAGLLYRVRLTAQGLQLSAL